MGIQEMLMHFHPVFSLFIIPLLLLFWLISIPYINYQGVTSGVWFCSGKGRRMAIIAVLTAIATTVAGVLVDEFILGSTGAGPPGMISSGLVPFAIVLAGCIGFHFFMKKKFNATNNEAIQTLFVLLTTAFVVLTVIGIWFRGMGMQLMWIG
jgi:hypothetical protein